MSHSSRGLPHSRLRRQLSNEGPVPGIRYNRYRHGADYAASRQLSPASGAFRPVDGQDPWGYDPIDPRYESNPGYLSPYHPDAPTFHRHTPPLMFELPLSPSPRSERPPRYDDALMTDVLFGRVLDHALDRHLTHESAGPLSFDEAMTGIRPPHLSEFNPPSMDDLVHRIASTVSTMEAASPSEMMQLTPDPESDLELAPSLGIDYPLQAASIAMEPEALPFGHNHSLEALVEEPTTGPPLSMMETALFSADMAMMPMAESAMFPTSPLMEVPDPCGVAYAMTLDQLVEQLAPEPVMPMPEMPDPMQSVQQQFDHQMQMMDPFQMMGPLG